MSQRVTKLPTASSGSKVATKKGVAKITPGLNELIVQFNRPEDPTAEQTERVRRLVRKYTKRARLIAELPGALKVAVVPETEAEFRQEVAALPDWDVASEGVASMPSAPLPDDDDEKSS